MVLVLLAALLTTGRALAAVDCDGATGRSKRRVGCSVADLVFYGVSNSECLGSWIGDVVELFQRREEAEGFVAECLGDESQWIDVLSVVEVDLHGPDTPQPSFS